MTETAPASCSSRRSRFANDRPTAARTCRSRGRSSTRTAASIAAPAAAWEDRVARGRPGGYGVTPRSAAKGAAMSENMSESVEPQGTFDDSVAPDVLAHGVHDDSVEPSEREGIIDDAI